MNWTLDDLLKGFKNKDRNALARAITLVESQKEDHQELGRKLIEALEVSKTKSKRLGISGTPGVGKSTFIEAFGLNLTQQNLSVAVLAVDPTSQVSGGSILGDKTRMEELSRAPLAFIRPSPSGGTLGGVTKRTRESIALCEAFGFDVIIVETVGVGQSETAVARLTDCFIMLLQPGAGDDLQGIKRGILELVDLVVVTKADGANKKLAEQATHHYQQALHILRQEGWHPPVVACSALEKTGIDEVWKTIGNFYKSLGSKLVEKRNQQKLYWLDEALHDELMNFFNQKVSRTFWDEIREKVVGGELDVTEGLKLLRQKLYK